MTKQNIKYSINRCWSKSDGITAEGFADLKGSASETQFSPLLDLPHRDFTRIFNGRRRFGKATKARAIPGGRNSQAQGIMGAFKVILMPPGTKSCLQVKGVSPLEAAQQIVLERAMKPFLFPQGLR